MERISLQEFYEKIRDSSTSDAELQMYLVPDPDASRPFAPALKPNPEKVEVPDSTGEMVRTRGGWSFDMLKHIFNTRERLRRQKNFQQKKDDGSPVLVSEGDSWFQFPLLLDDVIDKLTPNFRIWSLGAAGDTLQNMIFDNPEYLTALDLHRKSFAGFLFSGGGNDIVGEDSTGNSVLEKILSPFEDGRDAPWYLSNDAFSQQLADVEKAYDTMIAEVGHNFPGKPVFLHGYGYAIPGRGQNDPRKPYWVGIDDYISRFLSGQKLGFADPVLQEKVVALMIDALNVMQKRLCGGNNPGGKYPYAYHVDARPALTGIGDWADELHPNNDGFARVSDVFESTISSAIHSTA